MRALIEMLESAPNQVPALLTPTLLREQPDLWPPIRARIIRFITMMNAVSPHHGLPTDYTWTESSNALYRAHINVQCGIYYASFGAAGDDLIIYCYHARTVGNAAQAQRLPLASVDDTHIMVPLGCIYVYD